MLKSEIERRRTPTLSEPLSHSVVAATKGISAKPEEKIACRNIPDRLAIERYVSESVSRHAINNILKYLNMLKFVIERQRTTTNDKLVAYRVVTATESAVAERKEKVTCRNILENMDMREYIMERDSRHATDMI